MQSLNKTPTKSVVNFPRTIVLINGKPVKVQSLTTHTTTFYTADNFNLTIPLNGQTSPFTFDYFSRAAQFAVQVYFGFPPDPNNFTKSDLTLVFAGETDQPIVNQVTGTVIMSGRDLTGRLIDTKTTQKFTNLTASQLATKFATEHKLTPVVTPTSTKLGVFYIRDQTLLTRETTEWDLLTYAAQQEDFVVYVEANNLIFKPIPSESSPPYLITYKPGTNEYASPVGNFKDLQFIRDMTVAQDVIVRVRVPYSPQTYSAFTVSATAHNSSTSRRTGLPIPSGKKQTYSFVESGLTREQALQFAQRKLRDISRHGIKVEIKMPGDELLKKDSLIKIQGTQSAFDSVYYSENVMRTFRFDGTGFSMSISAKNHPVDSKIIV